jgi:hypothetical protein
MKKVIIGGLVAGGLMVGVAGLILGAGLAKAEPMTVDDHYLLNMHMRKVPGSDAQLVALGHTACVELGCATSASMSAARSRRRLARLSRRARTPLSAFAFCQERRAAATCCHCCLLSLSTSTSAPNSRRACQLSEAKPLSWALRSRALRSATALHIVCAAWRLSSLRCSGVRAIGGLGLRSRCARRRLPPRVPCPLTGYRVTTRLTLTLPGPGDHATPNPAAAQMVQCHSAVVHKGRQQRPPWRGDLHILRHKGGGRMSLYLGKCRME